MSIFGPSRVTSGSPAGGQFAGTARRDTGLTLPSMSQRWEPLSKGVDGALELLTTNLDLEEEVFPAVEHAAALSALYDLADALLARRGVPPRQDDELGELRTVVAEEASAGAWPTTKTDLVLAALGTPDLARKADLLARMGPGDYRILAVHYLSALQRHSQGAPTT